MGFTSREFDHAECGGVYISANLIMLNAEEFVSSTPNIGAKKSKLISHHRGTSDWRRSSQNGFLTPLRVRSRQVWRSLYLREFDHAECKSIPSNPNIWSK